MTKTIEIRLDDARELMYDELAEMFGDAAVDAECEQHIASMLTDLYDRRDELQQQR